MVAGVVALPVPGVSSVLLAGPEGASVAWILPGVAGEGCSTGRGADGVPSALVAFFFSAGCLADGVTVWPCLASHAAVDGE